MAITVKHSKTSTIPDGSDTDLIRPSDWNADHTLTGLGTMAEQNANNVAITGGSINGTSLGATTAGSAKVTTLDIALGLTLATDAGTSGQVLTSAGAGSVPTWTTPSSMTYPGAGIANSTGSAWGTSYSTTGTGTVVALQTSPSLTSPTIDGANPYIQFNNGSAVSLAAGRMWYDGSTGSWNLGMGNGNITQQVGEEQFIYGKASAAITEGQLIVKTGVVGASGTITFGPSPTGLTDNDGIIGVATENIALNGFGRITTFGVVHGINTSGSSVGETWADNDTLWYNPSYAGGLTKVKPSAPNIKYEVATVIHAGNGGSGSIQVNLRPGSQLGGTDQNVQLSSPTGGQLLTYSSVDSYWKNTSLAAGTGISVGVATNGVITVTNSAPDQTVAFTNGTGISVTGTYPNFTITNTSPSSGGTVTSVTGTAPISSSGGNTPAISISQATTSTNGYLSSTDWNTFNGKQAALVSGTNIKTVNGTTLLGSGDLGTITAAYGGTGLTSVGTSGNVLTSNGTAWVSSAPSGVTKAQAIAYAMTLGF